jgi:hypothetical protein
MQISDVLKDIMAFTDDIVVWLNCVKNPTLATKDILDRELEERKKFS